MWQRFLLLAALIGNVWTSNGQERLLVGLVDWTDLRSLTCRATTGAFRMHSSETNQSDTIGQSVQIGWKNGQIYVPDWPLLDHLILVPIIPASKITLIAPRRSSRSILGAVHIRATSVGLECIAEMPLEAYISGVVVAEAGKGHATEFYHAQAIVSRTYSVQAQGRHAATGFDVCNTVHCQVFAGLQTVNDTIWNAVLSTQDVILVDGANRPIIAAFHSNCGGHTQGSEAVWQHALPYLKGIPDPFCLHYPHSHWEKSIASNDWKQWLETEGHGNLSNAFWLPKERTAYLMNAQQALNTQRVRNQFGLRSGFFVALQETDSVRFIGQGFGHGVGMCQEGAMGRAASGWDAWEILSTYYHGVHLAPWQKSNL